MNQGKNENFMTKSITIERKKPKNIKQRTFSGHNNGKKAKFKIRTYPKKQKFKKHNFGQKRNRKSLVSPKFRSGGSRGRKSKTTIAGKTSSGMSKIQFDSKFLEIGLYNRSKTDSEFMDNIPKHIPGK
jgi:hypothetical protein